MHKWVFLACFPFFQKHKKKTRKVLSKFLFLTQTSFLSISEEEASFSFFLCLEKKAFTPNHQFGRQEKDFIHQARIFFELVKIGGK
jgi:hypothetical protein